MAHEYTATRVVEFSETDLAGIVHFSHFFRWMESAEHEFVRSLGSTVHGESGGLSYGFVRAHASCDYTRPLRYPDKVEVHLWVKEKTSKAFTYEFTFRRVPEEGEPEEVATGRLEVVCVTRPPGEERVRAVDMPAELQRLIEVAS